jgi:hypothetical protein
VPASVAEAVPLWMWWYPLIGTDSYWQMMWGVPGITLKELGWVPDPTGNPQVIVTDAQSTGLYTSLWIRIDGATGKVLSETATNNTVQWAQPPPPFKILPPRSPTSTTSSQQTIQVISVSGPLPPINPGGPIVEISLKNVGLQAVVSLSATLEAGRPFVFSFDASPSIPLLQNQTTSKRLTLIGGGFSSDTLYSLTVNVVLQDGSAQTFTQQVRITAP